MSAQNDPMAEIRASFFMECEELLEALQDGLQTMDDGSRDSETINIVFRAVHSIKGGAGAFGLEALVRFAHRFETVMDEVRAKRLEAGPDALKVFFQAADHLSDLVRASRDDLPLPAHESEALVARLDAFLPETALAGNDEPEVEIDFQPMGISLQLDTGGDGENPAVDLDFDDLPPPPPLPDLDTPVETSFRILFAPTAELFDTGNEPALLLRNLESLGAMRVSCDASKVPELTQLSPEIPHLVWQIALSTTVDEAEIASVFEFVEGLCRLEITGDGIDASPGETTPSAIEASEAPAPAIDPASQNKADQSSNTEESEPHHIPAPAKAEPAPTTNVAPQPAPASDRVGTAPAKTVVRVDLDRIERLVNLVGELVINQAMLSQSLEGSGLSPHSDAMNGLEEFQRLTRDIQDSVMMIRAQPVKSLFQRMSRIVREASAAVGKDVRLVTEGEATEVDRTVIERLADPLTHMIRNAVDHGLESKQDRIEAGKPAQGRLRLSAAHKSGRVVIEVSDDGAGIDRPRVQQIAIEKGLIPADAALSDSEIDNLLFMPGFSTAKAVSDLSGRGVGMDVVRTSIQSLGGRITTASQPGQGTSFSISLPLTLAVLDGMVVEVAGETLVLPLNVVIETLTLQNKDVEMLRPGRNIIRVRNGFAPLFDLGGALGYRAPLTDFDKTVVLLIGTEDGNSAALVIDNILDQRQVVIKGIDEGFSRAPGIAAATILGDGKIALILDPSDIISNAMSIVSVRPQAHLDAGAIA